MSVKRIVVEDSFFGKEFNLFQIEQIKRHCYVSGQHSFEECCRCIEELCGAEPTQICNNCPSHFDRIEKELEWAIKYAASTRKFWEGLKGKLVFIEASTYVPRVLCVIGPISFDQLADEWFPEENDHY